MKLYKLEPYEWNEKTSPVNVFIRGKVYKYIEGYLQNYMRGRGFLKSFYFALKYPIDY